jgi:hypothetical protein
MVLQILKRSGGAGLGEISRRSAKDRFEGCKMANDQRAVGQINPFRN